MNHSLPFTSLNSNSCALKTDQCSAKRAGSSKGLSAARQLYCTLPTLLFYSIKRATVGVVFIILLNLFFSTAAVAQRVLNVAVASADLGVAAGSLASANNGISAEPIINSGATDRILLGATLTVTNRIVNVAEPKLTELTITFTNSIANVLKSPKLYQSNDAAYDAKDALVSTVITLSANSIKFALTTPPALSAVPLTYFLKSDVDPSVSSATPVIVPSLSLSNILVSQGTISGSAITGRTYSFKDASAPLVASLVPAAGSRNVLSSGNLTIQFNEPVTSLNRTLAVYTLDRIKVADLFLPAAAASTSTTFTFPANGGLANLTAYYIAIPQGNTKTNVGFIDAAGNAFAGLTRTFDWSFKTNDPVPPKFVVTPSTDKNPDLKNDLVDITLGGANLQVALDKAGKVFYLLTPSPSQPPTAAQVFSPATYSGSVLDADFVPVYQDSTLQYGPVSANLIDGAKYDVWVAAENSTGGRVGDAAVQKITFTASDPAAGPYDPLIVSSPSVYELCVGDYQPLAYPITISERQLSDFSVGLDQTFNVLLPAGYVFNTTAPFDTVLVRGGDISLKSFAYVGTTVLKVVFSIASTLNRDKLIINGLQVKTTSALNSSGTLIRLGGMGFQKISDFAPVGSLKTVRIPAVAFDLYDAATNKLVTGSISNKIDKISLRPHIAISDYGTNTFVGDGVTDDELSPTAAGLGQHTITSTHTNQYGCSADTARSVSIYDYAKAVNGMDTLYNINSTPAVKIKKDGKGLNYRLEALVVTLPLGAVSNFDVDITQSLSGPDAMGAYVFDPTVFNTTANKAKFNAPGGRLGTLIFVGGYRNLSTNELETFNQTVGMYVPPKTSIAYTDAPLVALSTIYCEDAALVKLTGSPQPADGIAGFFTFENAKPIPNSGLIDALDGNATLDSKAIKAKYGYGTFKLRYIAQNTLTKGADTTVHSVTISPKPIADFKVGTPCVSPEKVVFTDASSLPSTAVGSIASHAWDFGDDKAALADNGSELKNPSHLFTDARLYAVSLTVVSNAGCASDARVQSVKVGGNPVVDFSFTGVSVADAISFTDASTVQNDAIASRVWDFADKTSLVNASATSVNHPFATAGVYNVTLTITGTLGCARSKMLKVGIVPRKILAATDVYEEKFEAGDGGWQTLRSPENGTLVSSWKKVTNSKIINSSKVVDNGTGIWKTDNAQGSYDISENSYLYSPSFDFSSLSRPVISFAIFYQLVAGNDGVVLQYSTDGKNIADPSKEWKQKINDPTVNGNTLGTFNKLLPSGANWATKRRATMAGLMCLTGKKPAMH
jgi:PKD repeat protein